MKLGYSFVAFFFGLILLFSGTYSYVYFNNLAQMCMTKRLMCPNYDPSIYYGIFFAAVGAVMIGLTIIHIVRVRDVVSIFESDASA